MTKPNNLKFYCTHKNLHRKEKENEWFFSPHKKVIFRGERGGGDISGSTGRGVLRVRNNLFTQALTTLRNIFQSPYGKCVRQIVWRKFLLHSKIQTRKVFQDVNFCKDHRDKIEVRDPLAVEDLISSKLNSKRKLASVSRRFFAWTERSQESDSTCKRIKISCSWNGVFVK